MNLSDLPAIPPDGFYKQVVFHWTAGKYLTAFPTSIPSAGAAHGYHICILGPPREGEAVISFPFVRNLRRIPPGGSYAAHTLGQNSGSVAVACCSMFDGTSGDYGDFPPTAKMFESMCASAALCVVRWGLEIPLRKQVTTHYQHAVRDGYFPNRWDWMHETERAVKITAFYVKELAGFIP